MQVEYILGQVLVKMAWLNYWIYFWTNWLPTKVQLVTAASDGVRLYRVDKLLPVFYVNKYV